MEDRESNSGSIQFVPQNAGGSDLGAAVLLRGATVGSASRTTKYCISVYSPLASSEPFARSINMALSGIGPVSGDAAATESNAASDQALAQELERLHIEEAAVL